MNCDCAQTGSRPSRCLRSINVLLVCLTLVTPNAFAQGSFDPLPPPTDNPPLDEPCRQQTITRKLPSSGIVFVYTKSFDCETGVVTSETVDKNGAKVDLNLLMEAESIARQKDPKAKITKELRKAIRANPGKNLRVIVWLTLDGAPLSQFAAGLLEPMASMPGEPPKFDERVALDIESQIVAYNRAQVSRVTIPFRKLVGNRAFFAATHAPVVGVRANARIVRALAALPEVDTLYLEAGGQALNREALFAHRVLPEWEASEFGAGRRIAVLEKEPLEDGLFLNVADYYRPGDLLIDIGHAQAVGGSIGSLMFSRLGSAPLALLFSANIGSYEDGAVTRAVDWVIENRMDVTNLSWGGLEFDGEIKYRDRLFDYHTRYTLNSFVAAAGNVADQYMNSPALAWNVIAVGNIETGPDPDPDPANWDNDRMYHTSTWINPITRNEKPNVAARGTHIKTLGIRRFGYIPIPDNKTGTSNAAPFVTAAIALAMNRNPTLLPAPETAMATIMASAWNNIEGRDNRPLSSKDGAGGIHTSAATLVAANFRSLYRYVNPSALNDRGFLAVPVQLEAGDRTRIAIAWSAAALSLAHSLAWLQTDLDLVVYEGRDTLICCVGISLSKFNNVEMVDFVPRRDGWHTIAIFAPRLALREPERVGIAISQYGTDVNN